MTRLALEVLVDDVAQRFDAEGTDVELAFGRRALAEHPTDATIRRIVWVPGDKNGSAGTIGPNLSLGGYPRTLATWPEVFHCVISAMDADDPQNERAQYNAVRLLLDAWFRACFLSQHNRLTVTAVEWLVDRPQDTFGAAVRVTCELLSPIFDEVFDTTKVQGTFDASVTELSVTDEFTVPHA